MFTCPPNLTLDECAIYCKDNKSCRSSCFTDKCKSCCDDSTKNKDNCVYEKFTQTSLNEILADLGINNIMKY